jgi:hypothetical protein
MSTDNKLNIVVEQNATFKLTLQLTDEDNNNTPIDTLGWTYTGSLRETYDTAPVMFFTMSAYPSASMVTAFLTDNQTWMLSGSVYYYDIIAHNPVATPPETYRLLQGRVTVNRGVTQP